jgi:hypothetical protein
MGLPFEDEGDFIIVQRALKKVHIDEIIEKSKSYKEGKACDNNFDYQTKY